MVGTNTVVDNIQGTIWAPYPSPLVLNAVYDGREEVSFLPSADGHEGGLVVAWDSYWESWTVSYWSVMLVKGDDVIDVFMDGQK